MAGRELLTQGSVDTDKTGDVRAVREFLIDTQDESAALIDSVIPADGSAHPRIAGATAQTKSVRKAEDGTCLVSVAYAIRDIRIHQAPDKNSTTYRRLSYGFTRKRLQFPCAVRQPVVVALPDGETQTLLLYQPYDKEITKTFATVTVELTIQKLTLSDIITIANQVDKVHGFSGAKWLFSCEISRDQTAELDILRYTWTLDPGDTARVFNDVRVAIPFVIDRPPFHEWVRIPAPDATQKPIYTTIPGPDEDLTGYQTLPGSPIT